MSSSQPSGLDNWNVINVDQVENGEGSSSRKRGPSERDEWFLEKEITIEDNGIFSLKAGSDKSKLSAAIGENERMSDVWLFRKYR